MANKEQVELFGKKWDVEEDEQGKYAIIHLAKKHFRWYLDKKKEALREEDRRSLRERLDAGGFKGKSKTLAIQTIKNDAERFKDVHGKEAKILASQKVHLAEEKEPRITKDMLKISEKTHGTVDYDIEIDDKIVHALDYKIKGVGSSTRKILSDSYEDGKSLKESANGIKDYVRYTIKSDEEHLVEDFETTYDMMKKRGYEPVKIKNTLDSQGKGDYIGLNTQWETADGYMFELQFHTDSSLVVKEENHKLYEKTREIGIGPEERERLERIQIKNTERVKKIRNADKIKNYRREKK